jgi:hypothetical protein
MSVDEAELERELRRQLPIINQPAVDALNAANAIVVAVMGPDTEVTDEEAVEITKDRDDLAREIERSRLAAEHGADNVFDTGQFIEHFTLRGCRSSVAVVIRKVDGKLGSLRFTHHPRLYFDFQVHAG